MIENTPVKIKRHRTAIKRASFSLPVKCMLRDGLLDKSKTMFDYGCGHGRDLDLLEDMEIECSGWDPSFRPDAAITRTEIVNLSYVLNVIEDINERSQALRKAWSLCDSLLTVAAQIEFAAPDKELEQFGDGVLTSRQTFQKYYNQHELREYLESELGEDAISAAPGVFYIFKDEKTKQQFIANRYHRRISVPRRRISEVLFEQNQDVLEPFMDCLTQYGRIPAPEELEQTGEIIARFGSLKRAFKLVQKVTDESPWEEIAQKRTEDLLVYLALARFKKRPPLSQLPVTIQHDVKAFLGGYKIACGRADALLFRVGDPDAIDQACQRATVGQLVDNALILHRSSLDYLEPMLRIYEGCARALVGEIDEANVIKLHRFSGKVSYISYPDFEKRPHPPLRQRIKVSLPTLSIDMFDYSNWQDPPLLFRKDELLHDEHPKAKLFKSLSRQESKHGLLPEPDARELESVWAMRLREAGLSMRGHRLVKST
ncbi:DNA phosphorothioation-associated putative methyltransferase [Stieleria tagensis]|uniref:DNA phosphorothioation-associated putative methyltransferase n=1 Tax=Stieleria tagensis TaxID=2956795 RepID=UPI0028F45E78|nr:DNA phosphorothioation-associated putative methyltransferase [Stieleria tagensis]